MAVLLFLLFAVALAQPPDVREEEVLENLKRLREEAIAGEELIKRVEKYKEELKDATRKVKERALKKEERGEERKPPKRKIYIFMSSSVPREVWDVYIEEVVSRGLNAVFLLRGCIGGCRYIKPTLSFIAEVLKERSVEVWIDPLKFREYGVGRVPCFAFEGRSRLSCGDWSIEHHLKVLADG
jgi:hypothetical protein